jgi:hypothetical protein
MATSPPPLPPSPSLDDLLVPSTPSTVNIPVESCADFIPDDASLDIFPPIDPHPPTPLAYVPPPVQIQPLPPFELLFPGSPLADKCYSRGRSRSRSPPSRDRSASPGRRHSPVRGQVYITVPSLYDTSSSPSRRSYSPESSRSPSPPPRRRRYSYRSRTPSPIRPYYAPPQIIYPPPPPPIVSLPSLTPPPPIPSAMWPPTAMSIPEPVDILTFHYNKNMAYAPAAKTYDVCVFVLVLLFVSSRLILCKCNLSYRRQSITC